MTADEKQVDSEELADIHVAIDNGMHPDDAIEGMAPRLLATIDALRAREKSYVDMAVVANNTRDNQGRLLSERIVVAERRAESAEAERDALARAIEKADLFADMHCVFCGCDEFGPKPRDHAEDCGYKLMQALRDGREAHR